MPSYAYVRKMLLVLELHSWVKLKTLHSHGQVASNMFFLYCNQRILQWNNKLVGPNWIEKKLLSHNNDIFAVKIISRKPK